MGNLCDGSANKISLHLQKQQLKIPANLLDTVDTIKKDIAAIKKVHPQSIIVTFNGETLKDNQTLQSKHFNLKDDHLNVTISTQQDKSLSITIRNINFTQKMQVKTTQTIKQVKKRIDRKHSINHLSQRLIFNGMMLNDDEQVGKYGIKEDSVVHLCIALVQN